MTTPSPKTKFTKPDGFCQQCSIPWWEAEHDHKVWKTLTPMQAEQAWRDKVEAEHAAESGE